MRVKVRYFLPCSERTVRSDEEIELEEGSSLRDLIQEIHRRYGIGDLISSSFITVNGKGAPQLSGLDTKLRPGDVICFMPPLSGG